MSEITTSSSFLDTNTLQGELKNVSPVESPELDFSAVESPTVDSPTFFEYEGPFGIGPKDDDLWFETRYRQRQLMRLDERKAVLDTYDNFEFGEDGSIKIKSPEFDLGIDFDFDLDLRELGFNLPEWNPDLRLSDLKIGDFDLPNIDLKLPDGLTNFLNTAANKLEDLVPDINLPDVELPKGVGGTVKTTYNAISQVKNLVNNPTVDNAQITIDAINKVTEKINANYGKDVTLPSSISDGILDVSAVAAIKNFVDDPSFVSAVSAYQGADRILEQYTDLEGLPGDQSAIAKLGGKVVMIVNAATDIEEFMENPNIGSAISTSAAVSNAIVALTKEQTTANITASNIVAGLAPIAAFYTGIKFFEALTYDQDYSRSEGIVEFKNGKFETTLVRGSDGGPLGYTHWADAHTYAATETLNSLIEDYGFVVDENALAKVFGDKMNKSYITNNSQYALQGGRTASASANDMILSLVKAGAFIPSSETPENIIKDEAEFGKFIGQLLIDTQDKAATRLYDQQGFVFKKEAFKNRGTPNFGYMQFGSQQTAQAYANEKNVNIQGSKIEMGQRTGRLTADLNFTQTRYVANSNNSLSLIDETFTVGETKAGKTIYKFGVFSSEEAAREYVNTNSGKVITKQIRQKDGRGYKLVDVTVQQDYSYVFEDGKYIIGQREIRV